MNKTVNDESYLSSNLKLSSSEDDWRIFLLSLTFLAFRSKLIIRWGNWMIFWGEILFTQGAVSQVLDSLEEMQCLTDCTGEEKDLIEKVFQDTKLHSSRIPSSTPCCWWVSVQTGCKQCSDLKEYWTNTSVPHCKQWMFQVKLSFISLSFITDIFT